MRILINRDTCESNGLCVGVAPELFELNDDDVLVVLHEEPSEAQLDHARRAVKLCPKQAITLHET